MIDRARCAVESSFSTRVAVNVFLFTLFVLFGEIERKKDLYFLRERTCILSQEWIKLFEAIIHRT